MHPVVCHPLELWWCGAPIFAYLQTNVEMECEPGMSPGRDGLRFCVDEGAISAGGDVQDCLASGVSFVEIACCEIACCAFEET